MTKMGIWKYLLPLIAAPCWGGILTVSLNPLDGALAGTPGGAVVWGVQAINSDANSWILITSVQAPGYAGTGTAGEIPDGPNAFTDYLSVYFFNNFTALGEGMAPGQVIDVGFSSGPPMVGDPNTTGLGLGSLAISPSAVAGTVLADIQIFYDIYDGDPFNGGQLFPSQETDVSTSVTVDSGTDPTGAPEPGTWLMVATATAALWTVRRKRQAPVDIAQTGLHSNRNLV